MSPTEPPAPEEFGPYLVFERLGVGGMATVHRAKKRGIAGFERGVALKRMLPHLAEDAEFINSFVREAKLASMLVHPNIAQIYDFGRVGAVYFIAMEHVDGFDVRKMLRYANRHKEPLPLNVVLSILAELCDALEYAHTFVDEHGVPQGIVHRDVSPSNLIVAQSGHLKVIDFGIARANVRQLHTESGRVKGKLGYMSPEAVSGRAFGPVSDVFSAGVVAHELLTAHPLFSAKTDYDTLIRIHEAEIPPPSRRNPNVPQALDEVVLAALSRDPERRLQSARAFREAIDYVADQAGVRFSARDVAEWRARIATAEDPWGARTSLPGVTGGVSRAFPESRSALSSPNVRPEGTGSRAPVSERAANRSPTLAPIIEEEKSVADFTWGSDGAGSAIHALPDQAQSVSLPVPDHGAAPPPVLASPTIGASIGSRPNHTSRNVLLTLAAVAVALAVYLFALRPKKADVVVAVTPASVKFIVQPSDALIEIGGKLAGKTSPFETQLEPGVYSVAVRRDGYKRWSTEITLREAEKQTVRVALELGMARVAVTSAPPGLPIQLDGKALEQVTPTEFQAPAGPHTVAVTNATGIVWSQEFTAEVDGKHTFHAPLTSNKRPPPPALPNPGNTARPIGAAPSPPERPDRNDRNDRTERVAPAPAPAPAAKDPRNKRVATGRGSAEEVRPVEPEPAPAPPPPAAKVEPAPLPAPEPVKVAVPAPPPAAAKTPVVSASAVTKLSGEIPMIKASGIVDNYADVVAKLCIDDHGRVASAKLLKVLPEIADELQRSLLGWRYKPYAGAAGPSPACFVLQFRMNFKHAKGG